MHGIVFFDLLDEFAGEFFALLEFGIAEFNTDYIA
jgi:hypothetical protein